MTLNSDKLDNNNIMETLTLDTNDFNSLVKPNIILIQLESFINPNWINNVTFNKNPVSNFDSFHQNLPQDYFLYLL